MGQRPAVLAAVPTPFDEDGEVDLTAAKRRFTALADLVDGVLVTGTTGEFPALTDHERMDLAVTALAACGPAKTLVHTGAPSAHQAAALTRMAARRGARRFAAITPYFFTPPLSQLVEYYTAIRAAAGDGEVYAYLFPERTGVDVTPDELSWVIAEAGLHGAKLSGTAAARFGEYAAAAPDGARLYSGDGASLAEVAAAGGAGVISAEAAVFPEPFRALADAVESGDEAKIAELAAGPRELREVIGGGIAELKMAQSLRGWSLAAIRVPRPPVDAATISALGDLISKYR